MRLINLKFLSNFFLVSLKTIPNFIKLIKDSIANKTENNKNIEEIIKKAFKNYKQEKHIKIYHSFEECENIIKQNLISENNFIIVDEYFFQYMNLNINDKNKKQVVINIDKNKSLYSITFPIDNKNLNFIELNPGIYQLKENTLNTKESFENKHNSSLLNIVKSK